MADWIENGYNDPVDGLLTIPDNELRDALIEKWWDERQYDWDSTPTLIMLALEEFTMMLI